MKEPNKMKKNDKIEILANLIWTFFGIFGGINYYSKSEYLISGVMFLIAILYGYKLIIPLTKK
jgi:hypothetical protein